MKMFFCWNQWENFDLPKVRWRSLYCHMTISLIHLSAVFIYYLCPHPTLRALSLPICLIYCDVSMVGITWLCVFLHLQQCR